MRLRGERVARIVTLDDSTDGYPWFASPSLVCLDGDRIVFGRDAAMHKRGMVFPSLKVRLLQPRIAEDTADDNFPVGIGPDLLVACYLSWALRRIKQDTADLESSSMFLNVAAPMDHIEDETLKTRYLRIVQAAWESVFGEEQRAVEQGAKIEDLKNWFMPWLKDDKAVPGIEHRRYEVLPETVAPIVSLSRNPEMAPGMYLIVDMGAGTTELSVNHVGERGADQRIVCYADESNYLGAADFEYIDVNIDSNPELATRRDAMLTRFRKAYKRTWYKGYEKDAQNRAARQRWSDLTVLLAGGGGQRSEISQTITESRPMQQFFDDDESSYEVTWHHPTLVDLDDAPADADPDDYALLAVAHGLSVPRQQWPDVFEPADVERLKGEKKRSTPVEHWW